MFGAHPMLRTGGAVSYSVPYALRFRAANSAYLSRTSGASPTSKRTFTYSAWIKAAPSLSSSTQIALVSSSANNGMIGWNIVSFGGRLFIRNDGANDIQFSGLFRDPSAWGHLVVAIDTTQATSSDRVKVYWNGVAMTYLSGTYPSLNYDSYLNAASTAYRIMSDTVNGTYVDGYLAEMNFIDGQALTPSSFGQTDSATGVWVPKKYSGTYGTNGFYLKFADASATATAIGKDSSGNGNNFTPSGISVTSGVTYDQMTDTPTLNYCVMSAVDRYSTTVNPSDANLAIVNSSAGSYQSIRSTVAMTTGKWYCEGVITASGSLPNARTGAGLYTSTDPLSTYGGVYATSWAYFSGGTAVNNNVSTTLTSGSLALNDVFQIAFDADAGKLWFGKNGTWLNSGDPATGANAIYSSLAAGTYFIGGWAYNTADKTVMNFGQRAFAYTPPTGFKALNTANLATPSIKKGSLYMDATLRTGTGATASVSSLSFAPDLVWIKSRSAATNNNLFDTSRGATVGLVSQTVTAEYTDANSLTAFSSNGYSLGSDASSRGVNINTNTYVDWAWKEGATPGFDVVLYTGNGTNRTVSHSLGVAPACYVCKYRSGSNADEWFMYHKSLGATKYIRWSQALGSFTGSTYWNDTAPTSSVFSLGTNSAINTNSSLYVSYLWSEIEGFSKFSSYVGNGSADGPFVWCGFTPKWIYIKGDSASSGRQYDTERLPYNQASSPLYFNAASAESAEAGGIDILSNGFKLRWSDSVLNGSGTTFIFMAFAENPFKYARAR